MANFGETLKDVFHTSKAFVTRNANKAAKATKFKYHEMSNQSKRRDLIRELGEKVFELSKTGAAMPAEVAELIEQINKLEIDLASLRSDRVAEKAAAAEQYSAEKAARAAEKAAAKAAAAIEKSTAPVEINMPEVEAPVAEIDVVVSDEKEAIPTLEVAQEASEQDAPTECPTLNV